MMPEQLTFDMPAHTAMGRADFMEAPCNAAALAAIEDDAIWPTGKLALVGPEGSGKTHLVSIWCDSSGGDTVEGRALTLEVLPTLGNAIAVENADQLLAHPQAQEALFHLHNHLHNQGGKLLVTGRTPPARWAFSLPDLASRLSIFQTVELGPPDDHVLSAILGKLLTDRQILPPETLIPFLVRRMDRSFAAARRLVAELDHRALSEGRPVSRTLAAEVLDSLQKIPE
jgi:chromosomal replication initiation ATPase DnaA